MKIPKKLKVGGRVYSVLCPYTFKDDTQDTAGIHDPAALEIKICDRTKTGEKRHPFSVEQCFMHELLHAVDYVYNQNALTRSENAERTIDQIAEGLLQVFMDNDLGFSKAVRKT